MSVILPIQERLDNIPKEKATLRDGLTAYETLKEIDEKIQALNRQTSKTKEERRGLASLKKLKTKALSALSRKDLSRQYTCAKRWIDAKYNRSFIETDPEGVTFVGESDFRSMQQFTNPESQLAQADMDLHFRDGKILFKVEDQWKCYEEIKDKIQYDPINKKFIGWTYLHPHGFVNVDSTEWTSLRPYGQLSKEAHEELKNVASKFELSTQATESTEPKIDPEKPCVLQVMVIHENAPPTPLFKNADKMAVHHCQVRLVDATGQVYCFGLWADKKDLEAIFPKRTWANNSFTLQTGNFRLSIPDPFENKEFRSDIISIPLSLETFEKIKKNVEQINKTGILYCLTNRNCCRLAQKILKWAGITIDTRISLWQLPLGCVPDAIDIPYLGRPLNGLSRAVSSVYSKMHFCLSFTPIPIKNACSYTGKAVCFIPKKILIALCSLVFLALGGSRGSSLSKKNVGPSTAESQKKKRLIHSIWDLFKEKTLLIYHPSVLQTWMQQKGSYQSFEHHGFRVTAS